MNLIISLIQISLGIGVSFLFLVMADGFNKQPIKPEKPRDKKSGQYIRVPKKANITWSEWRRMHGMHD